MTPEEFREQVGFNPPAWHRRPTGPGWWVCFTEISGHVHLSAAQISEQELKRGACSACDWVYGPIPEPPENVT